DTTDAIAGRRRLHDLGVTGPLLDAIAGFLQPTARHSLLDAGCGEGFYPGSLAARTRCQAHGVDISIPAIDAAAKRYKDVQFVVANADRFIPYQDASFDLVTSITSRMN